MEDKPVKAEILDFNEENIKISAEYLRKGELVAFPTETVYGLGANALNESAIEKIFKYKGRPLSDPLIVHVTSIDSAKGLLDLLPEEEELFEYLAKTFWPGPFTPVMKAKSTVSPMLTANTGFLSVRYPKNEIAQALINASGLPLAAPSANKFCHVSPVTAEHVFVDFKEFPLKILNGGSCSFCMESTVVKPDLKLGTITILRMGALSPEEIKEKLSKSEKFSKLNVEVKTKSKVKISNDSENQEAPGQFTKHYSPSLETYLLSSSGQKIEYYPQMLEEVIFLDFAGNFKKMFSKSPKHYKDLSPNSSSVEVMHNLYDYLRWAETITEAKIIYIADISLYLPESDIHYWTLYDRIHRASSGKQVYFATQSGD